jgi:DNA repair ATPase RecN
MWRALKSLKQFLKTDECFEPLLVMLNEYIILLEQLVFEKKQDSKKLGFNTNKLFESTQKLKMVEQDMKCFKLPISINNCLP